jgi:putative heme-binding domain-containing protein
MALVGGMLLLTGLATLMFRFGPTVPAQIQAADAAQQAAVRFEPRPGDHIVIIGNTLADRMQHDGWLETKLHSRFPTHDFVIRNLGFSGDEVFGYGSHPDVNYRLRSQSFGTGDQWLAGSAPVPEPNKLVSHIGVRENRFETTETRADVVFAFFGYNESFAGAAGLENFKSHYDDFIKHTLSQKYNGKSNARLVLFSPIAHENLKDPNLPDGSENNKRLELYTQAMAEVAKKNGVPFVDLFHPTLERYAKGGEPLTINGIHLNSRGNEAVARIIDEQLFAGQAQPKRDPVALENLRQGVVDKNLYWFNRYRVLDGYNIYGGRAFMLYADRQSNYEDQQRELEILDVKTANRERRVWALARGQDIEVSDNNAPPLIPVKTNKPGTGPNGTHVFVDGEEAIKLMTVAKNMKVSLFASEKEFPELAKPVQMQFDPQGRLWVAVWPSYPRWKPTEKRNDKILIFEDTKGTGKADKVTVFADGLNCPTGFDFYNGGVLVAQAPDIWFLKDTKGTGTADLRVRVVHGLDSADSHHTSNSFATDPGGAVYFQEGTFHHSQVESPYGPPRRCVNAGVFRYEPRTQKFDVYVTYGFANPHGHVWDAWGQDFVFDGTGANPYHGTLFSGHLDYPQKHPHPPQVYQQRTRPLPGVEILTSRLFPPANQGNLLVGNVIGFQGILQYKFEDKGSSFGATEVEPLVFSTDPNFRPSDMKVGPDGAVWFLDWHNPIIGHLQHAIRDPSRDRTHGRIYRVTYEGRDLMKPVNLAGAPVEKLLDALKEPENRVRGRARAELGGRAAKDVLPLVAKWVAGLDPKDHDYEHHVLEALWLHQSFNDLDLGLLDRELHSKEPKSRAAATRVLVNMRDKVPDAIERLKTLAADANPRVRLEAVRGASFFTVPEALEIALISNESPSDVYLDYVRGETMKALEPYVKKAINEGKQIQFTSKAGARYFLKSVGTEDLLKMKRTRGVYLELLFRSGVRDEFRREALAGLAKLEHQDEIKVLIDAVKDQDAQNASQDEGVVFDLVRLLTSRPAKDLSEHRAELEALAKSAQTPVLRQLGYVALVAADGSAEKVWDFAITSVTSLQDLVNAMPLIRDPSARSSLYPKVRALLDGLPKNLAPDGPKSKGTIGRYVRIEIPGKRKTLTLAEVEVYSEGRNVARQGKASQKNTGHGGDASKAIDGNTQGSFGAGGQTHTEENTDNPWWEVDLGSELPLEAVVIYNRTDGGLGKRLDGFTLKVLDAGRHTTFEQKKQAAPAIKASYELSPPDYEGAVRRAAMSALVSVRGQEAETFKTLANFVRKDVDRATAVQMLQRIPVKEWPAEEAKPLLETIMGSIRKLPTKERTTQAALDSLQLADSLASLLPAPEAKKVRHELGELGVRVLRVGTLVDQMLYDKERLVVAAGKPVEFIFENGDIMPHNFVIIQPGALEEVGLAAEAMATQPGAMERQYVPSTKKILLSSRLLRPRESQKLSYVAPSKPGVYPYVCTYPGHWRRMFGALYVVDDLEAYQADPEKYLATTPLPVADPLLKFNRPRKEWTYDELSALLKESTTEKAAGGHGPSFANGKQLFVVANCAACHKLNGVGYEVGPDLSKLDPKVTADETLRNIIEPSWKIHEKYYSWVIETQAGKLITGLIVEETPDAVKILENPLAKSAPVVIKKSDIAERKKSMTSIMPKGLMDKLTKDEIFDLLSYVVSGGNEAAFKEKYGEAHGHHGH